ncbi:hypothetical protein BGAL_0033g00130 [Botrytis galanthina]|uniref:Uncharacterized protein n=1 Tax=Botrytis galanthina TaxID=278940 RepID=A0A4S8RA09_9HELO|nr:hypothetical protein BGAL_0033g00130 [Botrytis galanthina]
MDKFFVLPGHRGTATFREKEFRGQIDWILRYGGKREQRLETLSDMGRVEVIGEIGEIGEIEDCWRWWRYGKLLRSRCLSWKYLSESLGTALTQPLTMN